MTRILGIHDGHNAAAALLIQGRVVAALQEERLTRVKNQGGIPALRLTRCSGWLGSGATRSISSRLTACT